MSSVIIKILSGVHLGAEIELVEGTWVFGRDDHCDIILSDKSIESRHAAFVVQTENGLNLTFQGLDGQVMTPADDPIQPGNLIPGSIYKLGNVYFAWGSKEATSEFWLNVTKTVIALSTPKMGSANDEAMSFTNFEQSPRQTGTAKEVLADSKSVVSEAIQTSRESSQARKGNRLALATCTMMLILAGVSLYQINKPNVSNVEAANGAVVTQNDSMPKAVDQMIKDGQFADVKLSQLANGSFVLTGSVRDDAERGRLVSLARGLKEPVVINVSVDSDYTLALQSAFNTMDFWPTVSLKKNPQGDELVVSAYMLSNIVEEKAFAEAQRNVPGLMVGLSDRPIKVQRKIRHREYMQKVFVDAFRAYQLADIQVEYLPGRVRFISTLTPALRDKLDKAVAQIHQKSPVPVNIEVVNLGSHQALSVTTTPSLDEPGVSSDDTFYVVGVSGGALKFVTLSTGEKIFVGGRLPGGYTLESIEYNQLVLSKNKKRINYPLKVTK